MSLYDANGKRIAKPEELEIPMKDIKIPEGSELKINFALGPYHVFFIFRNRGYDIFKDEYNFEVGYTSIDTRPPKTPFPLQ